MINSLNASKSGISAFITTPKKFKSRGQIPLKFLTDQKGKIMEFSNFATPNRPTGPSNQSSMKAIKDKSVRMDSLLAVSGVKPRVSNKLMVNPNRSTAKDLLRKHFGKLPEISKRSMSKVKAASSKNLKAGAESPGNLKSQLIGMRNRFLSVSGRHLLDTSD